MDCKTFVLVLDILVRIERLAAGNPGDVKPVGEGVSGVADRLWPRISGLLQKDRKTSGHITGWRQQEQPVQGHKNRLTSIT